MYAQSVSARCRNIDPSLDIQSIGIHSLIHFYWLFFCSIILHPDWNLSAVPTSVLALFFLLNTLLEQLFVLLLLLWGILVLPTLLLNIVHLNYFWLHPLWPACTEDLIVYSISLSATLIRHNIILILCRLPLRSCCVCQQNVVSSGLWVLWLDQFVI